MSEGSVRFDSDALQQRILALRGERVMVDSDLAELYGVEARVLNQAVKRNAERFPVDFSFVLTKEEKQEVITKCDHLQRLKFSPHLPRVFTEHGAIMVASVLNSPRAVEMSVFVVRAFVRLRQVLVEHPDLAERLDELEARVARHDNTLSTLVATIRQMATPPTAPSRQIGFVVDPLEKKMILPPAILGMLGGGQLGRFFVSAAHELGYQVWVLDPDRNSPAAQLAERHFCVDYNDYAALDEFAAGCAAITTEFENVPADTLDYLAKFVPVRPSATAVGTCQNRIVEKSFLRDNGLPHGPFAAIRCEDDIRNADTSLFPAILKVARFGYDGKGQATVHNVEDALIAFGHFKGEHCVLEQRLTLDYEVSVVLARDQEGRVACFPTGENQHTRGILDVSIVPARTTGCVRSDAEDVAARIAEKLGYIGTMGVEFFISRGQLIVNEMAPRPHNSGHYTIDACVTDQFEQQVRALCGLPLGEPRAHSASVMVNLLGDLWYENGNPSDTYREPDWAVLHAIPNLKLHLYGKHHARPGRKMGHFTVIGDNAEAVQKSALAARAAIGIKGE